jgi:hypothetical protein
MKFNWGTGIALVYGTFAIGMLTMVFISRQHDPGLVQKDYYNLDLNYQEHLNGKQNAAALAIPPQVTYNAEKKEVIINLPEGMFASAGNIKMFRSATVNDDMNISLKGQNQIVIPAEKLVGGRWHVELTWVSGEKNYYFETAVTLTHV